MPPARPDSSRPKAVTNNSSTDKRRPAAAAPALEKQPSNVSTAVNANGAHAHEGIEGIPWDDIPLDVLHKYRMAYRLPVPSASQSFNHIVLSSGIGKKSPSRVRARTSKEQLATAVRKNFNAQPIQENDVIVNFLYSIKNQDKKFKLLFPPPNVR